MTLQYDCTYRSDRHSYMPDIFSSRTLSVSPVLGAYRAMHWIRNIAPSRLRRISCPTISNLPDKFINLPRLFNSANLRSVVLPAALIRNDLVEFLPVKSPALPERIKDFVDVLPRILNFRRWYYTERSSSVPCFVVTADVVPASITFPEREAAKVRAMRVDFRTTCKPCINFPATTAAVNFLRVHVVLPTEFHSDGFPLTNLIPRTGMWGSPESA